MERSGAGFSARPYCGGRWRFAKKERRFAKKEPGMRVFAVSGVRNRAGRHSFAWCLVRRGPPTSFVLRWQADRQGQSGRAGCAPIASGPPADGRRPCAMGGRIRMLCLLSAERGVRVARNLRRCPLPPSLGSVNTRRLQGSNPRTRRQTCTVSDSYWAAAETI
jgi:hypothetical protein